MSIRLTEIGAHVKSTRLSGYEIKKRINTTLKYFWSASYGSIYPALNDLVNRGLAVKREDTENKRNKLIYTITDDGRKYLKDCLNDDTAHKYYLLTVEFGIKTYSTYLEWCKEAKKLLIDNGE